LSLSKGSGLTLHFDELCVLNLSKEVALFHPAFKDGASAVSPSIELRALSLSKGSAERLGTAERVNSTEG
jgi:hypothetical protein